MAVFSALVEKALRNRRELRVLRPVVINEILHHDILRELSRADLLNQLTFIGGTCLRVCYGSSRLSENLGFTGGSAFNRAELGRLKITLETRLAEKYNLPVTVIEPRADRQSNVDTWELRMNPSPEWPEMPTQRVIIDIFAVPSYQIVSRGIRNHYEISLDTESLTIKTQTREEIFIDKLISFVLRPGKLKFQDLWDIAWLTQSGVEPAYNLLNVKLSDLRNDFHASADEWLKLLANDEEQQRYFANEMARLIPPERFKQTVQQGGFWAYLFNTASEKVREARGHIEGDV